MTEVMLQLGDFGFSVSTAAYDALKRSTTWNWAAQKRFGSGPARQFLGKGDDSVTLSGVVFTEKSGLNQLERLRTLAGKGEPQNMVDQYGYVSGRWCIESIEEMQSGFFADGAPRRQEFSMKLTAYGEDE